MTQENGITVEAFKSKAAKLSELIARYGVKLSNAQSLEVLAKLEGARNWSAHSAALKAKAETSSTVEASLPALDEDDIAEFMLQRIENGYLALEDIPTRLARYGLMQPDAFVAEMQERMAGGCDAPYSLSELYALWDKLGNVPTAEDSEDSLDEPFLHFQKGTPREEVWHWFEAEHPEFIVGEVMQGIRKGASSSDAKPYRWYEVALYAGEETFLGKLSVPAQSAAEARKEVFDELWDHRLDGETCRSFVDEVDSPEAEAVALWVGRHYDEDALDELVHDVAQEDSLASANETDDAVEQENVISSREAFAADINNGGFEEQVKYLLETLGADFTSKLLAHLEYDAEKK